MFNGEGVPAHLYLAVSCEDLDERRAVVIELRRLANIHGLARSPLGPVLYEVG